jgi:glycosyltransferase involved in cell wall biosynthesis
LRVAFLTQWYPPEPILQPQWIAEALHEQGAAVEVLTGVPNYPDGVVRQGYRSWRAQRETIGPLAVRRAPLYASHDSGATGRILNYVSWALSAAAIGFRLIRRADVALVYSSPATAAFPAIVGSVLSGTPYVLIVQDLWPDSVYSAGMVNDRASGLLRGPLDRFVALTYRLAASIVTISPGMARTLVDRGVPERKLTVVYNWIRGAFVDSARGGRRDLRSELGIAQDDFVVMYAGNIGAVQGLNCTIEAVPLVDDCVPLHVVFVGDGIARPGLERMSDDVADRVHFVDPVPRAEMAQLMSAADAQLVSLTADPLFEITIPSKLQAVMAEGHPVLAVAGGDVADLVKNAGAGCVAAPGDPRQVARAISDMYAVGTAGRAAMGRRGQALYRSEMAEAEGSARLLDVLQRAARAGRSQAHERQRWSC